jgi:hypothetical protein
MTDVAVWAEDALVAEIATHVLQRAGWVVGPDPAAISIYVGTNGTDVRGAGGTFSWPHPLREHDLLRAVAQAAATALAAK